MQRGIYLTLFHWNNGSFCSTNRKNLWLGVSSFIFSEDKTKADIGWISDYPSGLTFNQIHTHCKKEKVIMYVKEYVDMPEPTEGSSLKENFAKHNREMSTHQNISRKAY